MAARDPVALGAGSRLYANQLSEGIRLGRYMRFDRPPTPIALNASGAITALYTAAQGQVDSLIVPGGVGNQYLEMFQSTAQSLPPTAHATKGLIIGGDVVDNETVEYVPGGNLTTSPMAAIMGTDPGVFIRATFEFADTSGNDQFCIGFRRQQAYQVPTSLLTGGTPLYTDFFGVGFSGNAAANLVKTISALNSSVALVTSLGFAWTDGQIHTLEVRVKGRKASVFINGVPTGTRVNRDGLGAAITAQSVLSAPAFTYDITDVIVPFIFIRYDSTTPGAIYLRTLEVGQLLEIGLQPESR